jgi:phosphoribosylformylglycinamidine cyclo-ligase
MCTADILHPGCCFTKIPYFATFALGIVLTYNRKRCAVNKVTKPNAYADAGVDVDIEAMASRIMYEASRKTYQNRKGRIGNVVQLFDDFAGLKVFPVGGLPRGSFASLGFDGAGTKPEVACRVQKFNTIAFDLVAMLTDDAVIRGGEPALIGSVLDIKSLGKDERFLPIIRQLADGYVMAANQANVAIFNGEIAQMGALISGYGEFPFNWGGACVWFGKRSRLISGLKIEPGHCVVLFYEPGFRCNGLSLVRKIYEAKYGQHWHIHSHYNLDGTTTPLGEAVMLPSTIYTKLMVHLHGGFSGKPKCDIYGAAHITGGGLPEKLGRMLRPSGFGVTLINPFEPGTVAKHCQLIGRIPDREAYGAWCFGNGMAVVTDSPDVVISEAKKFGIEAQVGGEITQEPGVCIKSRGGQNPGAMLMF